MARRITPAWSRQLDAPDRILHLMRRAGVRGKRRWERISWEAALGAIAGAMLDAYRWSACRQEPAAPSPQRRPRWGIRRLSGCPEASGFQMFCHIGPL
jgi:anaerobic selenocysteine-containing dehydrogenase